MPSLQTDPAATVAGSPLKKNRLSLKFFQKKETKRTLDFSESQAEGQNQTEQDEVVSCDQVVPVPTSAPLTCEKRENQIPFVGLNNLGNTCYLNSILQVLYYCPGFKDAIKKLFNLSKQTKERKQDADSEDTAEGALPANMELLSSFHSLVTSIEQLQSGFLLNPDECSDGELATPPRRLLSTLRQLNPMYEGYLQHDAQEVLRCILGYIQEACEYIQKEHECNEQCSSRIGALEADPPGLKKEEEHAGGPEDGAAEMLLKQEGGKGQPPNGKRKSDTEAGNAKKRPKSLRCKKAPDVPVRLTRSKRKSCGDGGGVEDSDKASKGGARRQKCPRLSWLKPSIFSKFHGISRGGSRDGVKGQQEEERESSTRAECRREQSSEGKVQPQTSRHSCFSLMEHMFQGQLVLRTRCLECECFTERREDFQDISVPVQEDEPCRTEDGSEVSPDPKQESKTLKWALSQFASVERIVGEDKYFCETCHHYTEAERSLLFDKTPEVVTIHLKCFAANTSECDPYAGLSKVNTPLHTPLTLSLEEWCTQRPSREHYELFAVVMHSGVTISSGHYTTYVKMLDLKDVKLEPRGADSESDSLGPEAPAFKAGDYDDGEVSFSLGGKAGGPPTKAGTKKPSDSVGLLGGQRSVPSFELGASKQAQPDKGVGTVRDEPTGAWGQRPQGKGESGDAGTKGSGVSMATSTELALCSLVAYEGKWMLFDDSEVRLFEEKDFLSACSPDTCTTSTPYLLFYKKVQG